MTDPKSAKLTRQERRAITANMHKCPCGNVLSVYRAEKGIKTCPRCDPNSPAEICERKIERYRKTIMRLHSEARLIGKPEPLDAWMKGGEEAFREALWNDDELDKVNLENE